MTAPGEFTHATGFGKLILFGEHAVVWGVPALVTGLGQGATASIMPASTWDLRILDPQGNLLFQGGPGDHDTHSTALALDRLMAPLAPDSPLKGHVHLHVPPGAGLGSSAALAAALARAVAACFDRSPDHIQSAVAQSEGVFHGDASGIDQAAALEGGTFRFVRSPQGGTSTPIPMPHPAHIVLCQPQLGASTSGMVAKVAARRARHPGLFAPLAQAIAALVDSACAALTTADWPALGELMDINHGLLCGLGVSTAPLDAACHIARDAAGALGAKLTGAGGGGCIWALAKDAGHATLIAQTLTRHGYRCWTDQIAS